MAETYECLWNASGTEDFASVVAHHFDPQEVGSLDHSKVENIPVLMNREAPFLFGFLVGGIVAVEVATLLRAQLFGLSPADPISLLVVGALLGGATLLACWMPARIAMKVDPIVALRSE